MSDKGTALTNLIDHFECNVKLQNSQHILKPGAHLLVWKRYVHSKNDVVGIQRFRQGLIETADLLASLGSPWHEPAACPVAINAFGGQVANGTGGTGSCGKEE